jgi:hypothetical protein
MCELRRSVATWLAAVAIVACAAAAPGAAAQPSTAVLRVTVVDTTGGVVSGALVTVHPAGNPSQLLRAVTDARGVAVFVDLAAGEYSLRAEFIAFSPASLPKIRLRPGENRQTVVLAMAPLEEALVVEPGAESTQVDRAEMFATKLSREQIDALSDDAHEMQRQLEDIAGPNATFVVDGFEGRALPPKAAIDTIRITRDQFAPEVHSPGVRVEVTTRPGAVPLRGTALTSFYSSVLDGKHPLVNARGPAQRIGYTGTLSGAVIPGRLSIAARVDGERSYSTPVFYAATAGGVVATFGQVRSPVEAISVSMSVDVSLTPHHTLRAGFERLSEDRQQLGIGTFDLPERGYSAVQTGFSAYAQQSGPLGRRGFGNVRLLMRNLQTRTDSSNELPTIIVNGAFTAGGAQRRGGTATRHASLAADIDYAQGAHVLRFGTLIDASQHRGDESVNYLGTYIFEGLASYQTARPTTYTRRIGDPRVSYVDAQVAAYIQDDVRLGRNLTVTTGVRYEMQSLVGDRLSLAPRVGVTWARRAQRTTTLRASWGVFYDWLASNTYALALELDGTRQREIVVQNPSFPITRVPPDATVAVNRYELASEMQLARSHRFSVGVSHTLRPGVTVSSLYSSVQQTGLLVGRNLNPPAGGGRPDPAFVNVIQATPEGRARMQALSTIVSVASVTGATGAGPLVKWNRGLLVFSSYTLGYAYDNTDGAFAVPAADLDEEWAFASTDRRHRADVSVSSRAIRNLQTRFSMSVASAPPITIYSGFDENGDLIFNDRPRGVGRNSARTVPQWKSSAQLTYSVPLGHRTTPPGGSGSPGRATSLGRYTLDIAVLIDNLFNQPSYTTFSGIATSPFFLRPVAAAGVRRTTFSAAVNF